MLIAGWWLGAELHIGLVDVDVRRQSLLVNVGVLRREIALSREQQAAAIRQLHEPLTCGAALRVLADQFGAIVAVECCREHLAGAGGALI